ncbi:MAG: glycosyltransferase [Actinomycetota bacterium]|nr:glycosyltransferase [Actinomycetota bacterium]
MKVLILARPVQRELPGGDVVHADKTAEALRGLGVDVDLAAERAPDLGPYDVVHLFNIGNGSLAEPMLRHAMRARALRRPVVVTPIYWDLTELRRHLGDVDPLEQRREAALQGLALRLVDRALPNSRAEAAVLEAAFGHVAPRIRVVPVGVEPRWRDGDARRFCARVGLDERRFVLCVARVEPLKNQRALIEACGTLGLPLVLAGAEYDEEYSRRCREAAEASAARVTFLPHLTDGELADAYAAARVHALPSWLESVGFSSLEAAVAGCNVVTTTRSGADEYLGRDAWYCDPASAESIRAAVEAAYAAPLRPDVGPTIAERFTWRRVADETLVAYREALAEHAERPSDGWAAPLSPAEYAEHVDDLLHLQLEAIALRDQELAELHRDAAEVAQQARVHEERADHLERRLADVEERYRQLALERAAVDEERGALAERVTALQSELERIHATKLLRYTGPLRRLYGRVARGRNRGPHA